MKKILLYNPPGGLWLRGEARCEQDLDNATAYTVTAPTSLCYLAAIFRGKGLSTKIMDCPVEGVDHDRFCAVVAEFAPDMAILNASVLNLHEDLKTVSEIRRMAPGIVHAVILPYFNSVELEKIEYGMFRNVDMVVTGEVEAVAYDLADFVAGGLAADEVRGVLLNDRRHGLLQRNDHIPQVEDLDALPFPARDLIRNDLYLRPDVGRPMAAIVDGKGCPSSCIYCLSPITTGKKVRKRSVDSVIAEIEECVTRYGIRDFLFRSDAFTINKDWVIDFCRQVVERRLVISWAANSKTSSFDREIAEAMKRAGCFLVEFGIESGSDESLKLQKKGTTMAQALKAVAAAKAAGLLTYGTALIGFPWEGMDEIRQTEAFIQRLDLDFIEIEVVTPYRGTELYEMMLADGLIDDCSFGDGMPNIPVVKGTRYLPYEELLRLRRQLLRKFYLRPSYVLRTLRRISSLAQIIQYGRHGIRLAKNLLAAPAAVRK